MPRRLSIAAASLFLAALACSPDLWSRGGTPAPTPPVLADSFFFGTALVDADGDGQADPDDPPLEGALFTATDARGASAGGTTDAEGRAMAWWPGASKYPVTLRMRPPEGSGHVPVGPDEVVLQTGQSAVFLFAAPDAGPAPSRSVRDFLYQLQEIDLDAVGRTGYDLIVMDYSADGSDLAAFTAGQIAALQQSPGGAKVLLAYLSIGEAEDYRYYWDARWDANGDGRPDPGAPAWLDGVNPDWSGNYKVRYWDPAWQANVFGSGDSYLDKIIALGFDGVYLDIVDAYAFYEDQGRESAAREMAQFVVGLAEYARARRPGFLVFPQNAAELASAFPEYLAAVDGIGQEDIYYGYPAEGQASPPDFVAAIEPHLDLFVAAGKTVLVVAYTADPGQIDDQYARARARGYVPFATVRSLDQLTINPGHDP